MITKKFTQQLLYIFKTVWQHTYTPPHASITMLLYVLFLRVFHLMFFIAVVVIVVIDATDDVAKFSPTFWDGVIDESTLAHSRHNYVYTYVRAQ